MIELSDFPAIYLLFKYRKMRKLSIEGNTDRVNQGIANGRNFEGKILVNLVEGAGKTTVLELLKKLKHPDWKLIDEPVAEWRKVKIRVRLHSSIYPDYQGHQSFNRVLRREKRISWI